MSNDSLLASLVAKVGDAAILWRRLQGPVPAQAVGAAPTIPAARPQGSLPTLKMPTAQGWAAGQLPTAAPGLRVNAFATGLKHPRWLHVLPNGDVTVAEALFEPGPVKTLFGHAMVATMRRAAAVGPSPNRITLLRDADGDGVAELRHRCWKACASPSAWPWWATSSMSATPTAWWSSPTPPASTRITAPGRQLCSFKPGGHWTRSLLASPDGRTLYAGVGSLSNIADLGMDVEQGRACIYALDLASGSIRIFAGGLRNPVGLAWEPSTGALWTVVNERDGLGDETPPDYLSSVRDGGFYGWPYSYWGGTVDDRVPQDPAAVASAIAPDYALGGHTASLGLCWMPAGTFPGWPEGMAIGQHGSWNRSILSGYKLVFVPFADGKPAGPPRDILSGFLAPDESVSYGRPVGVVLAPGGGLLMADDVGDVVWRVVAAG